MADNIQHEDFGEKIGGAKKDLWKDRGLYVNDLDAMNEREAEKFVKKDNIWKKPDYQAMLDDGIPLGVVYFIKKARDGLNASPQYYRRDDTPEKRLARQKEYIQTVRELQGAVSEVRTVEDAMQVYDRFFVENGYLEQVQGWGSGIHYQATEKGRENPAITNKLSNTLMVRSAGYFERNFTQKAQKEQFGVSKDQKVPKGYAIHFNDGKNTYSKNNDWKPDTWYVTKGYSILQTNFETREAALKWVQELAKGRSKSGKTRFVPPQLIAVRRTGPDYRNGAEITGQHYLDTFGFRGGEFGNWMNQNDRQASLNMGFEALKDLAAALQVSDKDIAYQGTLAIAFGARGSGNAAAHYEPLRKVINLTKMHGAGSLAHEWWHGLDDYLGTKMGAKGMLSEQPRLYAQFQKLIEAMKYKPETPEQAAKRTEAQTERTRKNAASWLDSAVLGSLKRHGNEEQMETYAVLREAFLSGEAGSVEQISAFKKSVTGRVIPKSERERLEIFEHMLSGMQAQEAPQIGRVETDFYRNSVRMGKECEKDGGYWDSNVEMTARAFACYIKDKLPYQSDYLAGHADCAVTFVSDKDGKMEVLKAYPEGEERRAINAVFDEIVADLKREQILTHSDVTLPLPAQPLAENEQISIFTAERPSVMAQPATQMINRALSYLRTPEVTHTANEWRKTGNWRNDEEISNRVYRMSCGIWEDTKYDRETKQSVPVAWYVTWDVYVNSPKQGYGEKIAGQNQKRYTDKAAAEKYLEGRKKAYSHLFTEISPQIPKQYEHHFTVYGALLPGYTVEGQEPVKTDRTAADVSEGGISMPEKPEKPSVLGKLSAAKTQEKTSAAPGAANKKKEDMQL
ncbi:LPD1 domain-containing protein [Ruminococcus sp. 5_1_39BFAA]|uniref:LPD1 domain-containing protein n=1 Tax=Ruminococcus sp. 5_1_39BFAA TaxID=457412 RepID=UPI0035659A7F